MPQFRVSFVHLSNLNRSKSLLPDSDQLEGPSIAFDDDDPNEEPVLNGVPKVNFRDNKPDFSRSPTPVSYGNIFLRSPSSRFFHPRSSKSPPESSFADGLVEEERYEEAFEAYTKLIAQEPENDYFRMRRLLMGYMINPRWSPLGPRLVQLFGSPNELEDHTITLNSTAIADLIPLLVSDAEIFTDLPDPYLPCFIYGLIGSLLGPRENLLSPRPGLSPLLQCHQHELLRCSELRIPVCLPTKKKFPAINGWKIHADTLLSTLLKDGKVAMVQRLVDIAKELSEQHRYRSACLVSRNCGAVNRSEREMWAARRSQQMQSCASPHEAYLAERIRTLMTSSELIESCIQMMMECLKESSEAKKTLKEQREAALKTKKEKQDALYQSLVNGMEALKKMDPEKAGEDLGFVYEAVPGSPLLKALVLRAYVGRLQKGLRESLITLRQRTPKLPGLSTVLSSLSKALGDTEDVDHLVHEGTTSDLTNDQRVHLMRAEALLEQEKFSEAKKVCLSMKDAPSEVLVMIEAIDQTLRCESMVREGNWVQALLAAIQARSADPYRAVFERLQKRVAHRSLLLQARQLWFQAGIDALGNGNEANASTFFKRAQELSLEAGDEEAAKEASTFTRAATMMKEAHLQFQKDPVEPSLKTVDETLKVYAEAWQMIPGVAVLTQRIEAVKRLRASRLARYDTLLREAETLVEENRDLYVARLTLQKALRIQPEPTERTRKIEKELDEQLTNVEQSMEKYVEARVALEGNLSATVAGNLLRDAIRKFDCPAYAQALLTAQQLKLADRKVILKIEDAQEAVRRKQWRLALQLVEAGLALQPRSREDRNVLMMLEAQARAASLDEQRRQRLIRELRMNKGNAVEAQLRNLAKDLEWSLEK